MNFTRLNKGAKQSQNTPVKILIIPIIQESSRLNDFADYQNCRDVMSTNVLTKFGEDPVSIKMNLLVELVCLHT